MPVVPYIQANTNGRLHSAEEPSISPLNRGFLYGDAIYEVWRTYHGIVFAWEEHFVRLESSARALSLTLPWSRTEMFSEVKRTVAAYREKIGFQDDVYIRLQVSRGCGLIGLDIALADRAEFVLLVQPCPANSPEILARGMRLSLAAALRRNPIEALSPAWKTGNYLNNILCLREARERGADDVVILNLRGEITELATSNIGFVRNGEVITPKLDAGILAGITRGLILTKIAAAAGLRASETTIRPEDLATMDECFTLSSTKDVTAVSAIDGYRFAIRDDSATSRLKAAFAHYARESAVAHPDLAV